MTTAQQIYDNYPEFSGVSTTIVERQIAVAENRINQEVWGDSYDDGVELLTAHALFIRFTAQQALGGALAAINQGKQPKPYTYDSSASDNVDFSSEKYFQSSPYGQEFLSLSQIFDGVAISVA